MWERRSFVGACCDVCLVHCNHCQADVLLTVSTCQEKEWNKTIKCLFIISNSYLAFGWEVDYVLNAAPHILFPFKIPLNRLENDGKHVD